MTRDKLLAAYEKGERNFGGAYLSGANLIGADLIGANLIGADLRGADLRGADLRGADLSGADLRGADLIGADLSGADLRGADLIGANLFSANLGKQWVVQGPSRADGYFFFLMNLQRRTRGPCDCRMPGLFSRGSTGALDRNARRHAPW